MNEWMDAISGYTASLKEPAPSPAHMGRRCRAQPVPWSPSPARSPPSSARTGEPTTHLASGPAGPARWQVMRVVWCLEPLRRSSLAAQRAGCAGRAAITCSPFFTLMLRKDKQVQPVKAGARCGRDPVGRRGLSLRRASPRSGPTILLTISPPEGHSPSAGQPRSSPAPGPRTMPTGHRSRPGLAFRASRGLVQCYLQPRRLSLALLFPTCTPPEPPRLPPARPPFFTGLSSKPPATQMPRPQEALPLQVPLTPHPALPHFVPQQSLCSRSRPSGPFPHAGGAQGLAPLSRVEIRGGSSLSPGHIE